jgi:hypothetical protein
MANLLIQGNRAPARWRDKTAEGQVNGAPDLQTPRPPLQPERPPEPAAGEEARTAEKRQCSIVVLVKTLQGKAAAYGVIHTLRPDHALVVLSGQLKAGHAFRFGVMNHVSPPRVTERVGRVTWTRIALNPTEHLLAESRVEWIPESERALSDVGPA